MDKENSDYRWARNIGHQIIESLDIEIRIDNQYDQWLKIYYDLMYVSSSSVTSSSSNI